MTGMVRMTATLCPFHPGGSCPPPVAPSRSGEASQHTIHYVFNPGTEDDYEAAVDAYEAAVYEAEERAIEEYYERKTKSR